MQCSGCGNESAYAIRAIYDGGRVQESCNRCGGLGSIANVPDVYFKEAYWDENLGTEQKPGSKFVTSRAHKAQLLKEANLREAGDRHHGATSFDPMYSRHAHENFRRQQNER